MGLVFLPFVIWRFEGVTLDFDFGAPAAACNVGPALKALVFGFLLDDFGFVLTCALYLSIAGSFSSIHLLYFSICVEIHVKCEITKQTRYMNQLMAYVRELTNRFSTMYRESFNSSRTAWYFWRLKELQWRDILWHLRATAILLWYFASHETAFSTLWLVSAVGDTGNLLSGSGAREQGCDHWDHWCSCGGPWDRTPRIRCWYGDVCILERSAAQ